MIAARTRDALARAKARGVKLGNRTNLTQARKKAVAAIESSADHFAANVIPIIHEVQRAGATTLREIAVALKRARRRNPEGRTLARDVGEERACTSLSRTSVWLILTPEAAIVAYQKQLAKGKG
jgi:hypothetical protein